MDFGSGNGLLPIWHQAIAWTSTDLLWIGPLGTALFAATNNEVIMIPRQVIFLVAN